jgi:hypothetical protein
VVYLVIWVWILLFVIATVRALTTALNKTMDVRSNGQDRDERLILLEDAEHWWMAFVINGLLLSIGVVSALDPLGPDAPENWHGNYVLAGFVLFAVFINIRIERHGYYYRKRQKINIWGRPTDG